MTIIRVTWEDIQAGHHDVERCPVALAATRALNRKVGATSCFLCFTLGEPNPHRHASLPPQATEWIAAYDRGDTVSPIEFEVDDAS